MKIDWFAKISFINLSFRVKTKFIKLNCTFTRLALKDIDRLNKHIFKKKQNQNGRFNYLLIYHTDEHITATLP